MDYIAEANRALEARARAFEERKRVNDDSTLTDAQKDERHTRIDADMARLEQEARESIRQAELAAEVRDQAAKMRELEGRAQGAKRPEGRDLAQEIRDLASGRTNTPLNVDFRVATVGTANNAGNTVADTFVAEVQEAMRERSAFFALASVRQTQSGETLEFPIKNGLNPATAIHSGAALTAENTTLPTGGQTWTKTSVGAFRYGVITQITKELLTDTELPLLSILAADAGEAVADVVLTDLLTGAGTTEPWGWVTRSTSSGVNAATYTAITGDNLLDLQFSLTAPYRRNAVYAMNDATMAVVRKLKVNAEANHYAWQPGLIAGQPDLLFGKPTLTDPNIATAGASAKVVVCGDPKKYMIRQVRNLEVSRSDEYGWAEDVVSLKITWRGSGELIDTNSAKALTVTA